MQLKKKIHFDSVVAFFLLSVDKCLIFSNYYGVELDIIGGSAHMKATGAEDALSSVPLGANSSAAVKGGRILYILHKMYKLFLLVAFFTAFFRHGCIF